MEIDENIVEQEFGAEAEQLEEVTEEEQDESESLESITGIEEPAQEPEQAPQATEPGWIKKRVEKAVSKAIAETEARMQAMFDQQMAPIKAKMMEEEAQELVRSRKVADIETARELVSLRNGRPVAAPAAEDEPGQPRQANGQYAAQDDPATSARIDMLKHQANRIKGNGGPDVIREFQTNEEIKQKVIAGEMDFYDVADYLRQQKPSRKPPSPMRSPNGASGMTPNAIDNMSDEQFRKLEKRIEQGARIRLS